MIQGLRPTPKDTRDFAVGALFKLPALSELPKEYLLPAIQPWNQKDSDYCSAFMSCLMSSFQEGTELSPEYSFALSKELSGDPEAWGQDLRTALKVHVKIGAIEKKTAPYSLDNTEDRVLRYATNWPQELKEQAEKHKKSGYFSVYDKRYDAFDAIRATLWHFRGEKRAIGFGVIFGWGLDEQLLNTIPTDGFGHAMTIVGFTEKDGDELLVVQNSAGIEVGENGYHYMPRHVVNHFASLYGAYMFADMPEGTDKESAMMTSQWYKADWKRKIILLFSDLLTPFKYIFA